MWKKIGTSKYYLQINHNAAAYEIHVTDFVQLWHLNITEQQLLENAMNGNTVVESFEIDKEELLLCLQESLLNPVSIKVLDALSIEISMKTPSGPIKFNLNFTEGSKEMFYSKVTKKLINIVDDLKASQEELVKLLLKKDKEINEYKEEGGTLYLKHLKTAPFDQDLFKTKYTLCKDFFKNGEVPSSLLQKPDDWEICSSSIVVPEMVKEEPPVVKTEPISQQLESGDTNVPSTVIVKQEIKSELIPSSAVKKRKKLFNM